MLFSYKLLIKTKQKQNQQKVTKKDINIKIEEDFQQFIWLLQQSQNTYLLIKNQMAKPHMKSLSQQELSKLRGLKQDVESIKQSKKNPKLKQSSLSNQPSLKQLQADRYLRMCYLMLRHGIYGVKKPQSQNYKDLYDYLCFYQDTYQLDDSKLSNTNKLHIFEAIKQSELKGYTNKLVIIKIQTLAENVHKLFQDYFKKNQEISPLLKTSPQLPLNDKAPLQEIITTIERDYDWERWNTLSPPVEKLNSFQISQQQSFCLHGLNAQTLLFIVQLISQLKKLSSKKHFQKKLVQLLQQFRQTKIKQLTQLKQYQKRFQKQKKTQKQKEKQKEKKQQQEEVQKFASKQAHKQIFKQNLFPQNKIDLLLQRKNETQASTPQLDIIQRYISQDNILQTLKQFSLLLQQKFHQKKKQPIKEKIQRQKLKQKLNEFNYGMMEKEKIKKLGFKGLMEQIKSSQMKDYMQKKEKNKDYLNGFGRVYEKHLDDGKRK